MMNELRTPLLWSEETTKSKFCNNLSPIHSSNLKTQVVVDSIITELYDPNKFINEVGYGFKGRATLVGDNNSIFVAATCRLSGSLDLSRSKLEMEPWSRAGLVCHWVGQLRKWARISEPIKGDFEGKWYAYDSGNPYLV